MDEPICKRCDRKFYGVFFHYIIQGCLFGYIRDKFRNVVRDEPKC